MKLDVPLDRPAYVVRGDDTVLLEDAVVELVRMLIGDADRALAVEELDAGDEDESVERYLGRVVDAVRTPPFLTDRRIVVARHGGMLATKEAVAPLVAWLTEPLPGNSLVLVWERAPRATRIGAVPKSLLDALGGVGGVVIDTAPGRKSGDRRSWIDEHLRDAPVKLDSSARVAVESWMGEDASKLVGLLPTLAAVYGPGAKVTAADLAPYLGEQGGVQPWDLTDAIDRGDVGAALGNLHRLLDGSGQHPLQVMAMLTNHYLRMVALDGSGATDERSAAALLGTKGSTFPAKKALEQCHRLGSERLAAFTALLAQADLDLKGAKAWPPELVVEVLVARLASRTPTRAARRGGRR